LKELLNKNSEFEVEQ